MEQDQLQRPRDGSAIEASAPAPTTSAAASGTASAAETATASGTASAADTAAASGNSPEPAAPIEATTTRRRFLRYLLGFSIFSTLALVMAPVVAFLVPPKAGSAGTGGKVLAGTLEDIPLGQAKVVPMGSKPTIVLNTAQGVTAFSAICTHLGCIVAFDDTSNLIVCPCHDGRFNPTTGAVVSGPPPAPLPPVTVSVEDDQIFLVEG